MIPLRSLQRTNSGWCFWYQLSAWLNTRLTFTAPLPKLANTALPQATTVCSSSIETGSSQSASISWRFTCNQSSAASTIAINSFSPSSTHASFSGSVRSSRSRRAFAFVACSRRSSIFPLRLPSEDIFLSSLVPGRNLFVFIVHARASNSMCNIFAISISTGNRVPSSDKWFKLLHRPPLLSSSARIRVINPFVSTRSPSNSVHGIIAWKLRNQSIAIAARDCSFSVYSLKSSGISKPRSINVLISCNEIRDRMAILARSTHDSASCWNNIISFPIGKRTLNRCISRTNDIVNLMVSWDSLGRVEDADSRQRNIRCCKLRTRSILFSNKTRAFERIPCIFPSSRSSCRVNKSFRSLSLSMVFNCW